MTEDEVTAFAEGAVATYAARGRRRGSRPALALATARASFDEMIPAGRPGPGQHLFTVRHEAERAGVLWMGDALAGAGLGLRRRGRAEAWRGRGLGAAAMVHGARLGP